MPYKMMIGAAGLLLAGMLTMPAPAHAQRGQWAQRIQRDRALCQRGYRPSCIRFGYALGVNRGRQAEWRRDHPDWFWWERW